MVFKIGLPFVGVSEREFGVNVEEFHEALIACIRENLPSHVQKVIATGTGVVGRFVAHGDFLYEEVASTV
jgi:hypothetical protein